MCSGICVCSAGVSSTKSGGAVGQRDLPDEAGNPLCTCKSVRDRPLLAESRPMGGLMEAGHRVEGPDLGVAPGDTLVDSNTSLK